MSIDAQFTMAGVAFTLGMLWTCFTFREQIPSKEQMMEQKLEAKKTVSKSFIENVKEFLSSSPEVGKICTIQFFAWIGLMSMMIFFTQYDDHRRVFHEKAISGLYAGTAAGHYGH